MRFNVFWGSRSRPIRSTPPVRTWIYQWVLPGAIAGATVTLWGFAQSVPQSDVHPAHSILLPAVNRPPDANAQMAMRAKEARLANFDAANTERKRQMTQESEMLVTMAMALKAEVDNTSSTKLSEGAIRKADTIEKLAHIVKEKMKLTIAPK
jgi:hypothetical protein